MVNELITKEYLDKSLEGLEERLGIMMTMFIKEKKLVQKKLFNISKKLTINN